MTISKPEKQITVNGVTVVKFEHLYPYFVIRNGGSNTIFASTSNAECTEGADGVISIPTGTTVNLMNYGYIDGNRTLYINGTGVAMVTGSFSDMSFKTGGGGNGEAKITPQVLGYRGTPILFYDGVYNWGNYHKNNGMFWVDIVTNEIATRYNASGVTIGANHYIKQATTETETPNSIRLPRYLTDNSFCFEIFLEITNKTTDEQNILNLYNQGFKIFTQNNRISAGIYDNQSNAYLYTEPYNYKINTKYGITILYNGSEFSFYVNGVYLSSVQLPLSNYKKTTTLPSIGGKAAGEKLYANGAYKIYRIAYYTDILTDNDILNNNGIDNIRFK